MTRSLRYLASSLEDLAAIADYIDTETSDYLAGDNFTDLLRARCRKLAALPGTHGTERPELTAGIRSTPSGSYVIYFRYTPDAVEVINVLHSSRDTEAHFRG